MTNEEIIRVAMEQSAKDIGCKAEDFCRNDNIVVPFVLGSDAKKYYKLPIGCNFISYGNNVVAAATDECIKTVLCSDRKQLDVLCVGAYDGDKLIGLSGCSADANEMWQIGVDVIPEYRRKGIASAITSRLALEILKHNKVPFYCSAWSNIRSARNAIKSGFIPSWAEMTVKPIEVVNKMNA